jgi:acetyl esterase/lipase
MTYFALAIAAILVQQPPVPGNLVFEPAVAYANADPQQVMDIVRPKDTSQRHPAVLCIHGGGFRAGSRKGYQALCIRLAKEGYVAATVDYRLALRGKEERNELRDEHGTLELACQLAMAINQDTAD